MTIIEAIIKVLGDSKKPMTAHQIYSAINDQSLYHFNAINPIGVVTNQLRRHCAGLDFPSAHPVKWFILTKDSKGKPAYSLINNKTAIPDTKSSPEVNGLPEEKIDFALKEHLTAIKHELLDNVLAANPAFFEQLVVKLLLKMGYGYNESAGVVTGASHDGGIDGIIYEDNLGLDLIYVQAKRYAISHKIGRHELQAFVGAMQDVNKGVFITTSSFTKEAANYIKDQQQKRIRLIDGNTLVEYMVKNEVGVTPVAHFKIYQIDENYFSD